MKKNLLIFLICLSSCKSFLFSNMEVIENVYVKDENNCVQGGTVIVSKAQLSCYKLFLSINTPTLKLVIPDLELNSCKNYYEGKGFGEDDNIYIVRFTDIKKSRRIDINWNTNKHIIIANNDICN